MNFNYRPGASNQLKDIMATMERLTKIGEEHDLIALKEELSTMIFILAKLVDLTDDKKIGFPNWMHHIETLLAKLILHTSSLNHLAEPIPIMPKPDGTFVSTFDLSSLYVITRAQIEAFLTFYYLILSPETNEQGQFYDFVYELSGLVSRQEMPAELPSSKEQKRKDSERIAELRKIIESHPYFLNIGGDLKNKLKGKKPPARLFSGWEQLIRQSHLEEKVFIPRWKYCSNYAHSEYISSLQLPLSFRDPDSVKRDVCHTIELALMAISVTIIELLNLIPVLENDFSSLWKEDQRIAIYFYASFSLKPGLKINRQFALIPSGV